MAKKKVDSHKKEEDKPKPVDRTQIYVAVIGLVGTIAVAFIAFLSNKTPGKPVESLESTVSQVASAPSIGIAQVQNTLQSNPESTEGCVADYFADIVPENQNSQEVGEKIFILIKSQNENTLGPFGIQFTENGTFIGALQFLGFVNSASFKITSVVDADCAQITDFGNIDILSKQAAIDNWGNLGFHLTSGNYRLRMGWYGGNQIELNFTSN